MLRKGKILPRKRYTYLVWVKGKKKKKKKYDYLRANASNFNPARVSIISGA
jgi:hypothetical protein